MLIRRFQIQALTISSTCQSSASTSRNWLFNLPDAEYQRCCPPDHVAAGSTTTDDGRRMSINVEQIGQALVILHNVGEITEKHHCRMVSHSDVYTPNGARRSKSSGTSASNPQITSIANTPTALSA